VRRPDEGGGEATIVPTHAARRSGVTVGLWRGAASGPVIGAVFKTVCGAVLPSWLGSTPMPLRQLICAVR
jgi:hypothetical protein